MNPGPPGVPALAPPPPAGAEPVTADGDVPWRPSKLRMARTDPDRVVPARGAVALPAVASGVGLALSLPPWGFWVLAFPAGGLLWWRLGGLRPRPCQVRQVERLRVVGADRRNGEAGKVPRQAGGRRQQMAARDIDRNIGDRA